MQPFRIIVAGFGVALLSAAAIAAPPRRAVETAPAEELGQAQFGSTQLPLVQEALVVEIDGQHVRTIANFEHDNRQQGRVEGRMAIRLAETASITGFSYWNGRERIVGEVLSRQAARAIYEEVVRGRRDPGLLEQIGPGEFDLSIYPIEPRERKRSQIVWEQWLEQRVGRVSYQAPIADHRSELSIELTDARTTRDFRSKTHDLVVESRGGKTRISAKAKRDNVRSIDLSWAIEAPALSMHSWVHRDRGADGYVVLEVAAPAPKASDKVAKDVTIVIDESGSMNGDPIVHTRIAAAAIVDALDREDRVNVVLFDDRAEPLFPTPKPANDANREKARRFIEGAGAGGGTDIALAMQTALDAQTTDSRPKSILLLTDGKSPREEAFAAVEADKRDVRLFTIGIGMQVDAPALEHLAALKRGRFTTIEESSAIESTIAQLYARMSAPVFVGLKLEAEGPSLVRMYPATLPDLFAGEEIVIAAKIQGSGPLDLKLTGATSSGRKTVEHRVQMPKQVERQWVGSMWARARITDLLTRIALGQDGSPERITEVTRLGIEYDIMTPYTSFLAIPETELDDRLRRTREQGRDPAGTASPSVVIDMDELRSVRAGGNNRDFTGVEFEADVSADVLSPDRAGRSSSLDDSPSLRRSASDDASDQEMSPMMTSPKRAGCAHCNTTDATSSDAWWLLLLLGLRRPRRRLAISP